MESHFQLPAYLLCMDNCRDFSFPLDIRVSVRTRQAIMCDKIHDVHAKRGDTKKATCVALECPRRESNPYRRCGRQDFKSCVSTSSTTGAICFTFISANLGALEFLIVFSKKNVSKQKIQTHGLDSWSGRPGSNRPPRPWQGRALPNELLPHVKI